ncbi:MAG: hypothetical protein KGN34_15565 [Sphingomonadales bacterium]|nr:hypothetical protein [Sphingomonadales bacterium]
MSVTVSFYQEQVDACAAAEAEANLPMLREKFRRAGAAWEVLASTARRTEAARAKREAESRERVAAAAEAAEVVPEEA